MSSRVEATDSQKKFGYDSLFSEEENTNLNKLNKLKDQILREVSLLEFHFKLSAGNLLLLEDLKQKNCFVEANNETIVKTLLEAMQELVLKISFFRKKSIGDPLEKTEFQNSLNVFFGLHFFFTLNEIDKANKFNMPGKMIEYHKAIYIAFQHFYKYSIVYALLRQGNAKSSSMFKNKKHYNSLSVHTKDEEEAKKVNINLKPAQPCPRETYFFYEEGAATNSWRLGRNLLCEIFQKCPLHQKSIQVFEKQLSEHNALWGKNWTIETLLQPDSSPADTPFPDGIEGIQKADTSQ